MVLRGQRVRVSGDEHVYQVYKGRLPLCRRSKFSYAPSGANGIIILGARRNGLAAVASLLCSCHFRVCALLVFSSDLCHPLNIMGQGVIEITRRITTACTRRPSARLSCKILWGAGDAGRYALTNPFGKFADSKPVRKL